VITWIRPRLRIPLRWPWSSPLPVNRDLPPVLIGGLCGGHRCTPIPWRDLQPPATNGRYVGIGGCVATLWPIEQPCNPAMQLGNLAWFVPDSPGTYRLYLALQSRLSAAASVLTGAEHGGAFTSGVGDDGVPEGYRELTRSTVPQCIAIDREDAHRWALWTGNSSSEVDVFDQNLDLVLFFKIGPLLSSTQTVVDLAYHHPFMAIVIRDANTLNETILRFDVVANRHDILATNLRDVAVAINYDTVIWSQRFGQGQSSQLIYWRYGFRSGGRLLFTPERGYDLKYPLLVGNMLVFARGFPPRPGQARVDRKTALLVYDLDQLQQADPRTCEIDDTAIWSDIHPLHGIVGDANTPTIFVAYFKGLRVGGRVSAPQLTVVCLP
jgi:hypothetical protein